MAAHVVIFPLPLQGPVNCMLKLAEILSLHNIKVTFLNSLHVHRRLHSCTNGNRNGNGNRNRNGNGNTLSHFLTKYPDFSFQTLPDGLSEDNPRTGYQILNLLHSMEAITHPLFREMMVEFQSSPNPVTCLIADGVFTFAASVAADLSIPILYFDTISPCGLWSLLCLPKLIQAGEVPFKDSELDDIVANAPGMEGVMRRRDLPSFCRVNDVNDPIMQQVIKEVNHIPLAQGLIFNTFQQLEAPILSQIVENICPNVYAVGPLHAQLKARLVTVVGGQQTPAASASIWEEDSSCIAWLDKQPSKSVVYVSIGSLAVMTEHQLYEIWYGLVNSGSRFLWVRRPGSVAGSGSGTDEIPLDLSHGTKERGCVVGWAPQEEVLAHPSIGVFFTHGGWNSTLESLVAGVPMISWPFHADQQVNTRYVGEVWKLGLDMKDSCDRVVVEKMIREVMELRKDEFFQRAKMMAKLAESSVTPGGSSFVDMDRLIQDLKMMKIPVI